MSARKFSQSFTMLAFLMGTLMFTLSSLPGQDDVRETSSSSSEVASGSYNSDCAFLSKDDAECTIVPRGDNKVEASVTLEDVTPAVDPTKPTPISNNKSYQATLHLFCNGDEDCGSKDTTIRNLSENDLKNIGRKVEAAYSKLQPVLDRKQKDLKTAKDDEKQRKKDRDNCVIGGSDDHEYKVGSAAQNKCFISQMKHMKVSAAADYFDEHVAPGIESKLKSTTASERAKAIATLAQFQRANLGDSNMTDYLRETLTDARKYNDWSNQSQQLINAINSSDVNIYQKMNLLQTLNSAKTNVDQYLYNRGTQFSNETDFMSGNFNMGAALTDQLAAYRSTLDSNFNTVLSQYQNQQLLRTANNPNTMYNGFQQNQTTAWPNTSFQNAGNVYTGFQQGQSINGLPVPAAGVNSARTATIPRAGTTAH